MMRRMMWASLIAAVLALCSTPGGAQTIAASWTSAVDSRSAGEWLAEAPQRVYGIRDGRAVAIDSRNGRTVWYSRVRPVGALAVRGNLIAAPTQGGVVFLDPASGRPASVFRLSGAVSAVAAASALDVISQNKGSVTIAAFDGSPTPKWIKTIPVRAAVRVLPLGGDVIGLMNDMTHGILVIDGRNGDVVAATDGVDDLVGADSRYLWFSVFGGGIKGLDLDTNRTIALHGAVVKGAVRVEHGMAIAVVDGRMQRIDLVRNEKVPLRINGRWIGGPLANTIFVERGDGLYLQAISGEGKPLRVVPYHDSARIVSSDHTTAFVGMGDGTVYVVDVPSKRLLGKLQTACQFYEGFAASGPTSLIHCDTDKGSRIVGFPRQPTV